MMCEPVPRVDRRFAQDEDHQPAPVLYVAWVGDRLYLTGADLRRHESYSSRPGRQHAAVWDAGDLDDVRRAVLAVTGDTVTFERVN